MIPKKRKLFFKEINSTRFSKFNFKLPKHTNRNFFHCSDDDLVKAFFCKKLVLKSAIFGFKKATFQLPLRSNLLDGQFSNTFYFLPMNIMNIKKNSVYHNALEKVDI